MVPVHPDESPTITAPTSADVAVLLPGTGSDDDFVDRVFGPVLRSRGIEPIAVRPRTDGLIAGYLAALDGAAARGTVLACGVSIGAAVALAWARSRPEAAGGVLAALPAWTGPGRRSPAAASARWTAHRLREDGLDVVTDEMIASSPAWLGSELRRSWRVLWPGLPDALDEAATYDAPTLGDLATIRVPVGLVAARDDAVHPLEVALAWRDALPRAALVTLALDDIGADPQRLGEAAVAAWDDARSDTRRG